LDLLNGPPGSYGQARARALGSNLGESGSVGRVECVGANVVPPMLFASSNPHDDFSIKFLSERIEVISMDLFCCRGVLTEAAVDGRIGECRG
jgi:hypothetical protein